MGKVFEFVCCLGIVGILILTDIRAVHRIQTGSPELTRVMLQGTDLVCFLEFCLGAVLRDTEDVVEFGVFRHSSNLEVREGRFDKPESCIVGSRRGLRLESCPLRR